MGNLALTSDYRFRGVSYSGSQPALQSGLTFAEDPGLFADIWGSFALAMQNGFVESFNGRMRDEMLNETLFLTWATPGISLRVG
jgi:hypothetical protein